MKKILFTFGILLITVVFIFLFSCSKNKVEEPVNDIITQNNDSTTKPIEHSRPVLSESSLVQPIFVNSFEELKELLLEQDVSPYIGALSQEISDQKNNAYRTMIERITLLDVIPYPTYDGVELEIPISDVHLLPSVRTEDAGVHYRISIDDGIYNLYFYCYEPYYKNEFDEGLLKYLRTRFNNSIYTEENMVNSAFMDTDVDIYWADGEIEYKIPDQNKIIYLDINSITFVYKNMIVSLNGPENLNHNDLLSFISHLGISSFMDIN